MQMVIFPLRGSSLRLWDYSEQISQLSNDRLLTLRICLKSQSLDALIHIFIPTSKHRNSLVSKFSVTSEHTCPLNVYYKFCSVAQSYLILQSHGLHHARPPCPSPTTRVYSDSCPLSQWCHPTISSSVSPFSSHLPSFPASGSFPVSQFFTSGGQRIGVSASTSVLPMNIPIRTDLL